MRKLLVFIMFALSITVVAETASAAISQSTADGLCRGLGGFWTVHPTCSVCKTCTVCVQGVTIRCHYIACDNSGCDYFVVRKGIFGRWQPRRPPVGLP